MTFFYDLNKKLDTIREKPEVTHKQLNERDEGKPGKNFAKIAKDAGERYGSKAAGERVAGAVRNKLKAQGKLEEGDMDESAFQAAIGKKKYGDEGMKALQKAGRDHASAKTMSNIRNKYDKYDEGVMDTVKSVGKKVASGINKLVGHGSDEDMRKDLQRKMGAKGAQVHGKKSMTQSNKGVSEIDLGHNVVRYYEKTQDVKKLTNWLEKNAGLPRNSPLYFDDVDLVYGDKTIVPGALVDPTLTFNDLLTAVVQASKQGMAEEDGAPMTAKQKSFAKLAPPADKITFADKIAGAKKEVDEMLGDVAAEAMRSALGGGRGRNAEMDEEKSKGTAFDMSTPRAVAPKVGSIERGHKHDIKHTATGRMVTRRTDDQGNSVGADDDSAASGEKRGRGRPKGTKQSIGAKGPSGKSKLMTREGDNESSELKAAMALLKKSGYNVTKAEGEEELDEKAVSKKQQKFMGMVHATQKGEKAPSKEVAKVAKTMKKSDAEDFASTKHKGLPEKAPKKKKEESVEESGTTSGSVAASTATGGKGGVYGKGIYDSMNFELEQMIAESMSINMSDSTEGGKSLTITATDEDALKLGMMLKNAGIGGGDAHGDDMHSPGEEACDTCGMPDCGCGDVQEAVDENAPDWPTNTEQADNNFGYSGGLNKPKTDVAGDGQTTTPNQAVHTQEEDALRRMMEMAGIAQADLEPWKETMKEDAEEDANDAENAANDAEAETEEELDEDFLESIQRMREIAGIQEAKKDVEEEKTEEGNLFTGNLAKARAAGKKQADLDGDGDMEKVRESIFALNNQWRAYKG